MKIQLSALVAWMACQETLAAFSPPPSSRHVMPSRTNNHFVVVSHTGALSMSVGNSTSDPLLQQKEQPTKKQKDIDPKSFASKMDAELDSLNEKIQKKESEKDQSDNTMDAYNQALQNTMRQVDQDSTTKKTTAGKGFGAPKATTTTTDKKKKDVDATWDANFEELKNFQVGGESKSSKTPLELIQEAKKAKESSKKPDVAAAKQEIMTPAQQMAQVSKAMMDEKKKMEPPKKVVASTPPPPKVEEPKKVELPKKVVEPVVAKKVVASTPPPPKIEEPKKVEIPVAKKTVVEEPKKMEQPKKVVASTPPPPKMEEPKKVELPKQVVEPVVAKKVVASTPPPPKMEQPKKVEIPPPVVEPVVAKKEETVASKLKKMGMKLEAPKIDFKLSTGWASKMTDSIMESFATVGKGGFEMVKEIQSSLNTTMVEDMDITYEEALDKMSNSVQGFVKICSILGDAVKDVAAEMKKSSPAKKKMPIQQTLKEENVQKVIKRASLRIEDAMVTMLKEEEEAATQPPVVEEPPKVSTETWGSYLDQLQEMKAKISAPVKEEEPQVEEPVLQESAPEKPTVLFQDLMSKNERDAMITSVFEQVAANANMPGDKLKNAMKKFQREVGNRPVDLDATTPLEEIKSKATSVFGNLKSSASSLAENVSAKANELQKTKKAAPSKPKVKNPFASLFNKENK
ncbi:expressed unknown protein [Seminavis robusta]|uniref:Uncharacterized protein n=1 Tax=Seminavis robusta TaxID=568900 RepID=A0A9N8ET93_9STRA|nr:expressed unknown protein [Seminavis robusta]|eukprot:Sro1565_g282810.1 n/a (685) ;mRNA; r:4673-6727